MDIPEIVGDVLEVLSYLVLPILGCILATSAGIIVGRAILRLLL